MSVVDMRSPNITPVTTQVAPYQRGQGAVIQSVAHIQEYKAYYGVQSATFTRTVFPGQATGTYRLNGMIPAWQGPLYTAAPGTTTTMQASVQGTTVSRGTNVHRSAGSPPIPYPPPNASAYYSNPPQRIVPNPCYKCYNGYG